MKEEKLLFVTFIVILVLLILLIIREEVKKEKVKVIPIGDKVVVKTTMPSPAKLYKSVNCYIERDIKNVEIRDLSFWADYDPVKCFFKDDVLNIEIPEFYYRDKDSLDVSIKAIRKFDGKESVDWKDIKVLIERKKDGNKA